MWRCRFRGHSDRVRRRRNGWAGCCGRRPTAAARSSTRWCRATAWTPSTPRTVSASSPSRATATSSRTPTTCSARDMASLRSDVTGGREYGLVREWRVSTKPNNRAPECGSSAGQRPTVAMGLHLRRDDVVTGRTLPLPFWLVSRTRPCRLAASLRRGRRVRSEFAARLQRDQGLAQRMLVAAVDGVCASAAAGRSRDFQVLTRESGERDLFMSGAPLRRLDMRSSV